MVGGRCSTSTTFHRPENSPPPPPPPPPPSSPSRSEKLGWISCVISSAGKFISSVLGSNGSDSYSSAGSSEEDTVGIFDVEEEDAANSLKEETIRTEKSKFGNDWLDAKNGSLSLVSEIKPKCAIEQLVLQETFTRDEGNRLIKIIQSRVVDDQSADCKRSDMQRRTISEAIASPGTIQCLDRFRILPDWMHHSSSRLNAVLSSDSSSLFDLGLRNLNRDLTQFDFQNEFDSPVKVAKSYMMSLPLCGFHSGHQATPPSAMHLHVDGESPASSYFLSSKFRKRNYDTSTLRDTFDNNRRVRFRSTWNVSNIPKVTQDKTTSDHTAVDSFDQPEDTALRDGNTIPASDISDVVTAANTMSSDHNSMLIPLSLQVSDPDTIIPVKKNVGENRFSIGVKDVEQPLENKEQLENAHVPFDSLLLSPMVTRRDGVHQQDIVYSEQKVLADMDVDCAPSSSAGLKA